MPTLQEIVAAKQKLIESKNASNTKTTKILPGKSVWRILPGWRVDSAGVRDLEFWHDYSQHWIKTTPGQKKPDAVHLCMDKTHGEVCQICMALDQIKIQTTNPEEIQLLKDCRSQQRYLLNALHVNGPNPEKVELLEVPFSVTDGIWKIIGSYGDITDPQSDSEGGKGLDLIIERTGTGFDTRYDVMPCPPNKSRTYSPSVLDGLHDLDNVTAQFDSMKETLAIQALGKVVGIMPPDDNTPAIGSTAATTSIAAALTEASSSDDASFEDVLSSGDFSGESVSDEEVNDEDTNFDELFKEMRQ